MAVRDRYPRHVSGWPDTWRRAAREQARGEGIEQYQGRGSRSGSETGSLMGDVRRKRRPRYFGR